MKRRFFTASLQLAAVMLLVLMSDCDNDPTASAPKPIVPAGNCIVQGLVKFSGPRPMIKSMSGLCCDNDISVPDETILINDNNTLRNVVVYIKNGPNVQTTSAPATLDQKNCQYLPHILAVRTNQPIDVTSHDPTMHNVNVMSSVNPPTNFSETVVGASHQLSFTAEEFIHIKCDVHPWMSANIAVFNHPFFAVTDEQGHFQIGKLPPGSYTLVAWHERYGSIEQPFTVSSTTPAEVTFDYKPDDGAK